MAESLTHGVAALNLGPNAPAAPPAKAGMFELQLERRSFFTKLGVDKNHWDALGNGLRMHAFAHQWSAERLVAEQATLAGLVARIEATKTEAAVFLSRTPTLKQLNDILVALGGMAVTSMTQVRKALKTARHINIYDLLAGRFERSFTDFREFRTYTKENKLIFPRDEAKDGGLRLFLRVL